ncbi:hypothetical protein GOQ04_15580 [Emticicia sp. ODNR4P]|jgi:hypothetical protein|nr:hypothetical protein [Emticicia sp. ODNR4P]
MKAQTLTKAKKQNWKPLKSVTPVQISAKNIEGVKIIAANTDSKKLVIA